jgi:hypothetical protein
MMPFLAVQAPVERIVERDVVQEVSVERVVNSEVRRAGREHVDGGHGARVGGGRGGARPPKAQVTSRCLTNFDVLVCAS